MAGDRLARILELLSSRTGSETMSLCRLCAEVAGASGAGIMLMSDDVPRGSVCTTDEVSALLEDLQYTLGEGPCVDAYNDDRPVLEPDLADPATRRWLAFTPPALDAGVRAVFGYPMQVGAARLGAVNLYRDRPGPLSDEQHADALVAAGVAAQGVLAMQSRTGIEGLAGELESSSNFHLVVHQAAGMVSVQLDTTIADALVRLRARAFADGRPLDELASDVVNRRLRFDRT